MVSVKEQIEEAIQIISQRRAVFAVADIAAYANMEGMEKPIQQVMQRHCGDGTLLNLDSPGVKPTPGSLYIRKLEVEKWWVRQTLRWAESELDCLTAGQLVGAMSLSFDGPRWAVPPRAVLDTGCRWAMVDDGSVHGTYVFPWASVLRTHPQFEETFRSIFDPESPKHHLKNRSDETYQQDKWKRTWGDVPAAGLDQSAIIEAMDEALNTLRNREAEIIRGRYGLDTGRALTLEELGFKLGITRERVRQIEKKALKRLKGLPAWYYGFAAHFIRSGGSLLISESDITPQWELLSRSTGMNTVEIPRLKLWVIGAMSRLEGYSSYLDTVDACADDLGGKSDIPVYEKLQFLPNRDAIHLRVSEREYGDMQKKNWTRSRMAYEVLRSLGCAAHYSAIADECNRLFPERPNTTHNWHAALLLPESQALGIVWIGRKGVYGLVEQGYSRPARDLFDAVASIVEARFAHTGQPVSSDFVIHELSRERQDLDPGSVNMALNFNDRLASKGGGRYVPKTHAPGNAFGSQPILYDFDAGLDAFLADPGG